MDKGSRHYNIDFIRFILAIEVVYFHILHSSIMGYTGDNAVYTHLADMSAMGGRAVELFLIIGGYFLYRSFCKSGSESFVIQAGRKAMRLWPVVAFYAVFAFIFNLEKIENIIYMASFTYSTGLSVDNAGVLWYIGPYFLVTLFILLLLKNMKRGHYVILLSVMVYFGYVINIVSTGGSFGRTVVLGFLSLAMLRVLAGIGLGVLLAVFNEEHGKHFKQMNNAKMWYKIIWTLIEAGLSIALIKLIILGDGSIDKGFLTVILFVVLFISIVNKKGFISQALDRPVLGALGKYSYSIYVIQKLGFFLLRKTLWKNAELLEGYPALSIFLSVLIIVGMGIGLYYLVEKPFVKLYKTRLSCAEEGKE